MHCIKNTEKSFFDFISKLSRNKKNITIIIMLYLKYYNLYIIMANK